MLQVLGASIGWIACGWLSGYLVLDVLRHGAGALRNGALAPIVAAGLNMAVGQLLVLANAPIRTWTILPASVGLPLAIWLGARLRGAHPITRRRKGPNPEGSHGGAAHALLALAIVLAISVWVVSIPSVSAVVPNTDGSHHALFTYRILTYGRLDAAHILSGGDTKSPYYPLAVHLTSALIAGATGASVNVVLTVAMVLSAAVVLPVGIFILTRRLCPAMPLVAGVAAVLAGALSWFPFAPVVWGGIPTIVAMSQVPAGIDAIWRRTGDGSASRVGLALGLAAYGLFQEHNTELVTVALFGFILVVVRARRSPRTWRVATAKSWAVGTILFAILIAPSVPRLVAGAPVFSANLGNSSAAPGSRVTGLLPPNVFSLMIGWPVGLLAALGVIVAIRRGWCRGWGVCLAATSILVVIAAFQPPVLRILTVPWYSAAIRVTYLLGYFEAVYAAVGIVSLAIVVSRVVARRRRPLQFVAAATALALIGATLGAFVLPASIGLVHRAYDDSSLAGTDQRAAFAWLADHVGPSGRVLNQFTDGSAWMEALDGVTPVFAVAPKVQGSEVPGWGESGYLLLHAAGASTDERAQRAIRDLNVQYIYVNGRHFDGNPAPPLSAEDLASSPAFQLAWHRGDVNIFRVLIASSP